MTRQRTQSAYEEAHVTAFVETTVAHKANVTFHALSAATDLAAAVLVILRDTDLEAAKALPFWNEALTAAVADAETNEVYSVSVDGRRVHIGLVTSKATRNNCAARPDVVMNLVHAAVHSGKGAKALDVVSLLPQEADVPTAAAVARGSNKSFTAKDGKAAEKFLSDACTTRVFLNAAAATSALDILATSVQIAMRLVDAPPNLLDTTTFPEIAELLGAKLGYTAKVIRGEALREAGYGGLYGVGKAAEFPPALVHLTYKPEGAANRKVALVGKGIVYDTGGLSIKVGGAMCGMKKDMGGAAAQFAAFITAVQLKSKDALDCILCCADNAISAPAMRNDDILVMKSGVTVEVNNTDAEGRLVLGDGVFHACTETGAEPDVVIDMATLTGAQGVATGLKHAAILTASEEWEDKMLAAGKKSGDLCFPILYCPEFNKPEYKSNVADVKNSVANRANSLASCAGYFIERNLPKDYKGVWVHVDMAYPVANERGAVGFGVALIAEALGLF